MQKRPMGRPSPSLVISLVSLFVALAGTGYAATGGTFILGRSNTATTPSSLSAPIDGKALQLTNTSTGGSASALGLNVAPGHAPFTVNSATRVGNLNADRLDGLDSASFLRTNRPNASGPLAATTASGNGLQGSTSDAGASGVYGENTSGAGFGAAGRAGTNGIGIYGDNTGTGWAGYFSGKVHLGGALDCAGCVSSGDVAPGTFAPSGIGDWASKRDTVATRIAFCDCAWRSDGTLSQGVGTPTGVSSITLPAGTWHIDVFMTVANLANFSAQNNERRGACGLFVDGRVYPTRFIIPGGGSHEMTSMRTVALGPAGGTVWVQCFIISSPSLSGQDSFVETWGVYYEAFRVGDSVPSS